MAWKDCPQERIEALSNKVIDFNQEKTFRDTIASQEQKVIVFLFVCRYKDLNVI